MDKNDQNNDTIYWNVTIYIYYLHSTLDKIFEFIVVLKTIRFSRIQIFITNQFW